MDKSVKFLNRKFLKMSKRLLVCLLFGAFVGCGTSNEAIKNEVPAERPPRPTMGGEKVKAGAEAPPPTTSSVQ